MVVFFGILFFIVALLIHVVIWRLRKPVKTTDALIKLFFGFVMVESFVVFKFLSIYPIAFSYNLNYCDMIRSFILAISLGLCWIMTYPAIEAQSPSLLIIRKVFCHGSSGISEKKLYEYFNDSILLYPRIADLIRDGLVVERNGVISMTNRGRFLVTIFMRWRNLIKREMGG